MSKEAMKQALEALEFFSDTSASSMDKAMSEDAITSLRQAIAEAEKQESMAWRNAAMRVGEDLCSVGPFGYYDMTAEQWLDWALSVVTVHAPPQPKREWVGLTDEEIGAIDWKNDETLHDFAHAIEAKLKEKNT